MTSSSHPLQDAIHEHSTQSEFEAALRENHGGSPAEGSVFGGTIGGRKLPGIDGVVGTMSIRVDERDRQDLAFRFYGSASDPEDYTRRDRYFVRATGELLVELNGDPLLAERPDEVAVETWFVDDTGRARFLGRPAAGARTVADLDQADAERAGAPKPTPRPETSGSARNHNERSRSTTPTVAHGRRSRRPSARSSSTAAK